MCERFLTLPGSNASVTIYNNLISGSDYGISAYSANAIIINNTIVNNDCGIRDYENSSALSISNSIFWNNLDDLYECEATYSCIEGGDEGLGNISCDPLFINPATGNYHLSSLSPCVDAGDNDVWDNVPYCNDIDNQSRKIDGWYVNATGNGEAPVVDIGADEWSLDINKKEVSYLTSFEESSGYELPDDYYGTLTITDGKNSDGWYAEQGTAYIRKAQFIPEWKDLNDTNDYIYQYMSITSGIISKEFDPHTTADVIRVNCIPSDNSQINITTTEEKIVSIKFDSSGYIFLWDGTTYQNTQVSYSAIQTLCQTYLSYTSFDEWNPRPEHYSYENTWMEYEILLDWDTQTYTVLWKHINLPGGGIICSNQPFSKRFSSYDHITFADASDGGFCINRISVSNESLPGGVLGENEDIWVQPLDVNMNHPIQGHYPIIGNMWYDKLGSYEFVACPSDQDPGDPDNWMAVYIGGCTHKNDILGYWDAMAFYNGDYYLKLKVYDDLGRLWVEHTKTEELAFNGQTKSVEMQYPLIGKLKGKTFHYEERPDIKINWPGSFPFEFQRTYDSNLRKNFYPLFSGWTHNHNIRIVENCTSDWIVDQDGLPASDDGGLGIGKLWLQNGMSCQMFVGHVIPPVASEVACVKYIPYEMRHLPLEQHKEYILRKVMSVDETQPNAPVFKVQYIYQAPDGRKLSFDNVDDDPLTVDGILIQGTYAIPRQSQQITEGLVDWSLVKGIDSQKDRFGNALLYTWNNQLQWHETEPELYLMEIANNRTSAKLIFKDELFTDSGPSPYSKIQISDGSDVKDLMQFSVTGTQDNLNYYYYKNDTINDCPEDCYGRFVYAKEGGDWLASQIVPATTDWRFEETSTQLQFIKYQKDRSLKSIRTYTRSAYNGTNADSYKIDYSYTYDDLGQQEITQESITGVGQLKKRTKQFINSKGIVIKECNWTYYQKNLYGEYFDPTNYFYEEYPQFWNMGYFDEYAFYSGGGDVKSIEYSYEDNRFPQYVTKIVEYLACDPQGGLSQPGKTIIYKYDEFGQRIEDRIYKDDNDYVLTSYEYHDVYNFPTKQTTWQDYCQDDANGEPDTAGLKRVETQWIYGLADGTIDVVPSNNIFLITEKTLLDQNADPSLQYAVTSYIYYPMEDNTQTVSQLECGQVQAKQTMRELSNTSTIYYEYDLHGLPCNEWQGANLANMGNPQKRYFFNTFGQMELEADYLGKVSMYVRDQYGRVKQFRIYCDPSAVYRSSFQTSVYDYQIDVDPPADSDDNWMSRTDYLRYDYYDKYLCQKLPTGGRMYQRYYNDEKSLTFWGTRHPYDGGLGVGDNHVDMYCAITMAGNPYWITTSYSNTSVSAIYQSYYMYDSMDRETHRYEYTTGQAEDSNSGDVHFVKHTESTYFANNQKETETVYKVNFGIGEYGSLVPGERVLEKQENYLYDSLDRLIERRTMIAQGEPDSIVRFGYDAAGNQIYVIDPKNNVIFKDYDNANRKTCEYFAVPAIFLADGITLDVSNTKFGIKLRQRIDYYLDNKTKSVTQYDHDGQAILACSEYTYDSRGRIESVEQQIDANNGALTSYVYSDAGMSRPGDSTPYHIKIVDAENKETWININQQGKPGKIVYPSGDYESYSYYGHGLLSQKSVWEGLEVRSIGYEYNEHGDVKKITYPDGRLEYEYYGLTAGENGKPQGKLYRVTDYRTNEDCPGSSGSSYTFRYFRGVENLRSYTDQDGYTIDYDYNTAYNQVSSVTVRDPLDQTLYAAEYAYDLAGRLTDVGNITAAPSNPVAIARLNYDENGNRSDLSYSLDGTTFTPTTPVYGLSYDYSIDNFLNSIITGEPDYTNAAFEFDAQNNGDIDGLGRLVSSEEMITDTTQTQKTILFDYDYDMMSQLLYAKAVNVGGHEYIEQSYEYADDGNVNQYTQTVKDASPTPVSQVTGYNYTNGGESDIMAGATGAGAFTLTNDLNGNTTKLPTTSSNDTIEYNWDNKLRKACKGSDSIHVKYDPMGNRVSKTVYDITNPLSPVKVSHRKFIVDINSQLPVVLCEIEADPQSQDYGSLKKSYFYADAQPLCQYKHTVDELQQPVADVSFYVHDRLGSVRLVVVPGYDELMETWSVNAANAYTYTPFGGFYEGQCVENIDNPFKFTGQWHDAEIDQYCLRARMYDPAMMRFTGRDPVDGEREEPLTLHRYLYCWNSPILYIDPAGEYGVTDAIMAGYETHAAAIECVAYGVDIDNDFMFALGTFLERSIQTAMAAAMMMPSDGPDLPSKDQKGIQKRVKAAMRNKEFSEWYDKTYKQKMKFTGGKGNQHNPDFNDNLIIEALEEWLGYGNSL
jgi:RHS repeat-associated protein